MRFVSYGDEGVPMTNAALVVWNEYCWGDYTATVIGCNRVGDMGTILHVRVGEGGYSMVDDSWMDDGSDDVDGSKDAGGVRMGGLAAGGDARKHHSSLRLPTGLVR